VSHRCHARECQAEVSPKLLCCPAHWRIIPRAIRGAVTKAYRHGQCTDKKPSDEWVRAATAAIGFIALREGRKLRIPEARELLRRGYRTSIIREYVKRLGESERGRIEETLVTIEREEVAAE